MSVPEREIVAVRTEAVAGHPHIVLVRLKDGTQEAVADVIAAIENHDAHYVMRQADLPLPRLVRVRSCPDCNAKEIAA